MMRTRRIAVLTMAMLSVAIGRLPQGAAPAPSPALQSRRRARMPTARVVRRQTTRRAAPPPTKPLVAGADSIAAADAAARNARATPPPRCARRCSPTVHFEYDQSDLRADDKRASRRQGSDSPGEHRRDDSRRRPHRRARFRRIQPRARSASRRRGEGVSRPARHSGNAHRDRQLRRGASSRPGIGRKRVLAESARRVRDHRGRSDAAPNHEDAGRSSRRSCSWRRRGCLASKSDIRLLQDELRATRAQLGSGRHVDHARRSSSGASRSPRCPRRSIA